MDDIDRSVISPSLINPAWDDPTKFSYNPDFDLRVDTEFLSALTSTDGGNDDGTVEQGQENIELCSAAKSTDACGENPSKCLKLSLSRAKSRDEFRPATAPMRDLTNGNADIGSSS